ncbi:MAG: protein-glutamate O-methyltransferase CheR [Hahellaceae bacterium]|nr:protein-glutamate O-methyltransferase CheR [Hahellaceae bacterium]MCP5210186.1 protein-glutamate O-methyltransferase CheR [Hahellaceae bacterium]
MADSSEKLSSTTWTLTTMPPIEEATFKKWQDLLEDRIGLSLPAHRKSFLQTSLGSRMREIGCLSYEDYYSRVNSGTKGLIEWSVLVDRLTVQETRFYRDIDALDLVKDYVLTRPIEQLKKTPIEAWSVGCSSGEEPYSLAMLLTECMNTLGLRNYFGITGTDISKPALEKARAGVYPSRKLVTLEAGLKEKYFDPHEKPGFFVLKKVIKERVGLSRVNILELGNAPMHGMNIIYCQNVLIYFRKWRRKEIISRLAERLVPGGLLILGQGEIVDWEHPDLQRVKNDKALAFIRRPDKN